MAASYNDVPAAPLDLVPLALRSVSNQQLTLVIGMQGRIDTELIRQALQAVVVQHPILGYQLRTDSGWPTWHRTTDTHPAIPLLITDGPEDQQLSNGFESNDLNAPTTVSTQIIRAPHNDTLKICVDHTVADATGAKEIGYSLASCYARLERGIQPQPLERTPPPRGLQEIRTQISTFRKLKAVCGWRAITGHWRFPEGTADHHDQPVYMVRHLGTESIGHLKTYCSRYAATIHDILMAALFSSLHDLHDCTPGERLPIQFTLDLRRYLQPGHAHQVANLSSSTNVWLRKIEADPFGQTLLDTHQALATVKRKTPGIGAALILEHAFKLGLRPARLALEKIFNSSRANRLGNPLFINCGVIDDMKLDFGSKRVGHAYMLGPSLLAPGIAMTASGFRKQLTLSAGFGQSKDQSHYVAKLLAGLTSFLPE